MKKFFLQGLLILCMSGSALYTHAQTRSAIIVGDTCEGSTLTGSLTSGTIGEVKWYKDTTLLVARGRYDPNGVIVAGGNGSGTGPNQMYDTRGLYLYHNQIYVVTGQSVQKWVQGATSGVVVAGGNGKGSALNQFYSPQDVVVDDAGNIYVSDYLSSSVRKWAPGATSGTIVVGGNGYGAAANQLSNPQSLCMDRFGNIYVSDRWNARVQKWAPGATSGTTVAGGNGKGSAANQLYETSGVAVDYAGNVYVADTYNYRVQKWAPGATTGVTVAGGNGNGTNANQLSFPQELSVDSAGNLYVLDAGRVQRWAVGATYGVTVAGGLGVPSNGTEMSKISTSFGMYFDPVSSQIYVSDLFEARVRKFKVANIANSQLTNVAPAVYKVQIKMVNNVEYTSAPIKITAKPVFPGAITGPDQLASQAVGRYKLNPVQKDVTYSWTVPDDATIQSGQGTSIIYVKWGNTTGPITVTAFNTCGTSATRTRYINVQTGPMVLKAKDVLSKAPEQQSQPLATIYPNPTASSASVAFTTQKNLGYELTVTNMAGKAMLKQKGQAQAGKNSAPLDISNFNRGVYIVNIRYADNTTQVLKISKQ
ncbi:T9SS type A sorting domain-containing protein [Mucilaginibacter celer]|uniref:T9SS C-terminal target domain-containing protein n=1 Tax=Mucilaginibacter celer TaxID=2305508 RepID=A0A494VQE8_9SPHI|nr:T9SS type A sorting domain-containing protein [Mucilaginibacter celer]AYL97776.1 T9SS C-terminal target domain-containing protein [Mucilaginibacter celer]